MPPSFLLRVMHPEQRHAPWRLIHPARDRLDEIGIGAAIECTGAVGYTGESGRGLQDDNMRDTGFDLAAGFDATQIRQLYVE
jgi:hypothetical protein